MKKIILLASFGVAGLVSAKGTPTSKFEESKAKTEIKERKEKEKPVQTCGVVVTYWSGGQVVGTQTITSDQPDLESCQNFQTGVKVALWAAGYWLS